MKKRNKRRVEIANCPIDVLSVKETKHIIENSIISKVPIHHVVVNAGKLVNMQKDQVLYNSVISSDVINADGQSIVWASKFLGNPLPERVAGIDLMESLVELAHQKGFSCYFFGAKEEVVQKVIDHYTKLYSPEVIAGFRSGYFSEEDEERLARDIAQSKADILFVAITSPKKEVFLNKHKNVINTPFIMGVGGSFDVIAGITKRAPLWMQKAGLEWFYRLVQEPRRMWRRYIIGNSQFILLIIKQKLGLYKNPFEDANS
ncbi:MAG: WecB/TagA/CpsF family glycosyltransferase [Cyclobacteriaceae bacterium]|nr:WecB/TagA/CpsF family glycosyltransferase [Cyclobacteriaceae bacterium]